VPSMVDAFVFAAIGALIGATPPAAILRRTRQGLRETRRALNEDDLTRIANRRAILADLAHARRRRRQVAVALLDVNHFKAVNDTYGHQTGDEVLCALAERLRSLPQPVRRYARLGGDEFVLLIDGDLTAGLEMARHAWSLIAATPVLAGGHREAVTVSIGVAAVPNSGYDRLLTDADLAMYHAKRTGQGVCAGTPATSASAGRSRRWRDRLRQTSTTTINVPAA
jgi:diguanylate cyclase